jgi:hypothetical protein
MVFQGHFTASARRLRAESRRPEADGDARTRFVLATEEPGPPRARRRASPDAIGKVADMQIELTLHPDGSPHRPSPARSATHRSRRTAARRESGAEATRR